MSSASGLDGRGLTPFITPLGHHFIAFLKIRLLIITHKNIAALAVES